MHIIEDTLPVGHAIGRSPAPLLVWGAPLDIRRAALSLQNSDRQLFSVSVVEDVFFCPLHLGLEDATVRVRGAETLAAVAISEPASRALHHLSFGQ